MTSKIAKPMICIVDPLSSSDYLYHAFKYRGYDCVAALISPHINKETLSERLCNDFDKIIFLSGQVEKDITTIRSQLVSPHILCLSGIAASVQYADTLANVLSPDFSNDVASSALRHDKALMMALLEQQGISAISSISVSHQELLKGQIKNIHFPCFIKPSNSSINSFAAQRCCNQQQLDQYIQEIPSHDQFGHPPLRTMESRRRR